jgi:lipopolysaccharide transport system ATP-binding protein
MTGIALEMDRVAKKFKKGEMHDSLRDLIPAFSRKVLKGFASDALKKNEFWALKDISFQVAKGEALGIIGANGAGKSTILKLLCLVMKPTEGCIHVNGTMSALIEVGAGFHPDLTGRENIFLNGTILGMKKDQIKKKFDEIVEFSGLDDFIDTPVKRYSSGMYARLGFSVAVHVDPEILVVDEVLSVGDHVFQKKCAERMKSVVKDGVTIVFVSHNLRAIAEMCDRCILLDHGKIVAYGPAAEVVSEHLNRGQTGAGQRKIDGVSISRAVFRGRNGKASQFESGEKATFDVDITATKAYEHLSIALAVYDAGMYNVFQTSTELLTCSAFSIKEGQTRRVTFELNLHLVQGTYHVNCYLGEHTTNQLYDALSPAATIYVQSCRDIFGIANLYPTAVVE